MLESGVTTDSQIAEIVKLTHGDDAWQNSIAWNLVDRDDAVSKPDAAFALALARDAVALDAGLDYGLLDAAKD